MSNFDVITIDTNIIKENGYKFDKGLLIQLSQLNTSSIGFILSEIVFKETEGHITRNLDDVLTKIKNSINNTHKNRLISNEDQKVIHDIIAKQNNPNKIENKRIIDFIDNNGGELISVDNVDIKKITKLYFSTSLPFEDKKDKKKEFPDAIALVSLENLSSPRKLVQFQSYS